MDGAAGDKVMTGGESVNVAYNIDCMEYMKTLPDKAFELADAIHSIVKCTEFRCGGYRVVIAYGRTFCHLVKSAI